MRKMIVIESCGYRAVVNPMGASLAAASCEGRDLIMVQNGEYGSPFFRGAVLAPWPNRLEDGYYEFGGQAYSLPINEPDRNVALHGLALDREWVVISREPDRVRLRLELGSDDGYPFVLSLDMIYALAAEGMKASLTATNNGARPAPYGCSFHPYFLPGEGLIDEVELRLKAHSWIELSADRLLPVGPEADIPVDYDLRESPRIGSRHLDATYGAVERDPKGIARVQFGRLEVWWDKTLPWVQVYTTPERDAVAIEPSTCPGNAFRTGTDLVVIAPKNSSHTSTWGFRER